MTVRITPTEIESQFLLKLYMNNGSVFTTSFWDVCQQSALVLGLNLFPDCILQCLKLDFLGCTSRGSGTGPYNRQGAKPQL